MLTKLSRSSVMWLVDDLFFDRIRPGSTEVFTFSLIVFKFVRSISFFLLIRPGGMNLLRSAMIYGRVITWSEP